MPIWKRDICGSEFEFSDWGVDVVSRVKPEKYAGLSDAAHWNEVATFECAGLARMCQHIVDTYPQIVSGEALGLELPLSFGINGSFTYNNDLTVSVTIGGFPDVAALQAWCDTEFGLGKVLING